MSKTLRAALIAFSVVLVLSFASSLLAALIVSRGGAPPSMAMRLWPLLVGAMVYVVLLQRTGNRAERRVGAAERTAALELVPPSGQALLVIMREGFVGKALGVDVAVDGRTRVQLRSPRAAVLPLAPGAHVVSTSAVKASGDPLSITLAAGEVAFVELRLTMGMSAGRITLSRPPTPPRLAPPSPGSRSWPRRARSTTPRRSRAGRSRPDGHRK